MKKKDGSSRKTLFWLTSLAIALAVHVTGLFVFQVDNDEEDTGEADLSFVSLPSFRGQEADGDLLREQAYLRDSAPLFLPTRWNAATSPAVRALEQRPADLFDSFPAHLSFGERDLGLGRVSAAGPGSALEILTAFGDHSHTTFGQLETPTPKLEGRVALLEVFRPSGGGPVLSRPVAADEAPSATEQLWQPAEFLIQVTAVGYVGEPVLLRGSGIERVDQSLRELIRKLSREAMLDVGYYRVLAGP